MIELGDVFRRYGEAYLEAYGKAMLPSHRRAIVDIMQCRTAALGGQVFQCDQCGHEKYVYHSCRNRACPKCHANDTNTWLAARCEELLPVPYFLVTFTLPAKLRSITRSHQKTVYALLMKTAAHSLIKLAADPRYVGAKIAVMAVLHTWARTLAYHPHVHCLVPAGGLSDDRRQWLAARKNFFVPVRALSKIFRGMFRERIEKALPEVAFPRAAWRQKWVVNIQPANAHGAHQILDYLGRYVHRIAITNRRMVSMEGGEVTFRYRDTRDACWRTMTLSAMEFIRRFLQHVLPRGVHKVRYYGLWAPSNRHYLALLQLSLPPAGAMPQSRDSSPAMEPSTAPLLHGQTCPQCGQGVLVFIGILPRRGRDPP